ncbi:MAG: apolipoprotein acyltransferase, partial [Pirellulaceae bacterium]
MPTQQLMLRCHELANLDESAQRDPDSLIGFFQMFRPDGRALEGLFDSLHCGADLHERLDELYAIAGDDRRPQGGRDAYFIVRRGPMMAEDRAQELATQWLSRVSQLAADVGANDVTELLDPHPEIRVLEGIPPKNPKIENEKSELLVAMQATVPTLCERLAEIDPHAEILRPAYYFNTCDAMVRDYLMWPLYATATKVRDPFAPYFELWRHRVKYRIFNNKRIDLY